MKSIAIINFFKNHKKCKIKVSQFVDKRVKERHKVLDKTIDKISKHDKNLGLLATIAYGLEYSNAKENAQKLGTTICKECNHHDPQSPECGLDRH